MSVQVEKLEKNMAKLTIEVPAEELEKAIEKVFQKQKKNISIPGFRKGKVPRAMVEKMYGKEVFYEDAANEIIPDAYEKAAVESGLEIVSRPEIDVVQIEKGKAFIFTNGKVIEGTWVRTNEQNPNMYYDENGNEIVLNQGKTWVCNIWRDYEQYMSWE